MKVSGLFWAGVLVGTLAIVGCGDDGTGGTAGTGGMTGEGCADADVLCAGCADGPQLNDCRNDVMLCNQADPVSRCETCIAESNPGCP